MTGMHDMKTRSCTCV